MVIYRREHLLLLAPRGKGLMATTLRYKNEVRDEKDYFDEIENIKVPADMLKLATQILESKKGHFDPDKFEDRYEDALMELIKAKRAGKRPPVVSEAKPSNVINLMDALAPQRARAIAAAAAQRKTPKNHAKQAARPRKRRSGRRAKWRGLAGLAPTTRSGSLASPPNRKARSRASAATPSSSRSTTRRACTMICGLSSTA